MNLEGELHPELNVAAASRTDERIAGGHVGCGTPAAERAGSPHVIGSTGGAAIAIRRPVGIGDDGLIEDVKELDAELSVVPLLEGEVLEYGEIHVPEGRVAEDIPAHGAEGPWGGWSHDRVAVYEAATRRQRTRIASYRRALRTQ